MNKQFLQKFDTLLNSVLEGDATVAECSRQLCIAKGAKRVRPQLVYLAAKECKLPLEKTLAMSVTGELVHSASLLHDDIIDDATLRRGNETVNFTHSNTTAVLTGDWLYSKALLQLIDMNKKIYRSAVETVEKMTFSAALEYQFRDSLHYNEADYFEIARGKTGYLFGWCLMAPFLEMGLQQEASEMYAAATDMGIAFQVADDIKDFIYKDSGKPMLADLFNGNPNYVLMKAIAKDKSIKKKVETVIIQSERSSEDVNEVASLIESGTYIDEALTLIESLLNSSRYRIENIGAKRLARVLQKWNSSMYKKITHQKYGRSSARFSKIFKTSFMKRTPQLIRG